ncbi:MAG: nudix-type nucleoside diphosphatase (YffH/AdpP family) [Parvicellaceae bacterium]|jgi:nudix-type nucleoside diphosphatase (YffH/AdpP family)
MKFKEISEELIYNGFFKFTKLKVEFDKYSGEKGIKNVEMFERGDSASIVLYETDTKSLLFTEQFRYPTTKNDSGWLMELVAGKIEEGESPESSTRREIEEEIGYTVSSIENIGIYYLSPGGTSERIHLFYAEVKTTDKTIQGGGKFEESEDIKLIKIKVENLNDFVESKEIKDAKTMIGVNWFLINKKND